MLLLIEKEKGVTTSTTRSEQLATKRMYMSKSASSGEGDGEEVIAGLRGEDDLIGYWIRRRWRSWRRSYYHVRATYYGLPVEGRGDGNKGRTD